MSKVIVIGGKGHIGTYLCPMLVSQNFLVTCITRGNSTPYTPNPLWSKVTDIKMDRETEPNFEEKIAQMDADYIIDLVNFKVSSVEKIANALKTSKNLKLYLYCSSIWAHGRAGLLPLNSEDKEKAPLCEYGKEKKLSEIFLQELYAKEKFPSVIIQPGQISGPGWKIINCWGNGSLRVFQDIADGKEIFLPNFGMETLHHVHGEDVAQMFVKCIINREKAVGQIFNVVSEQSITLYGYAQILFKYFKKEEKIGFKDWKEWCEYEGNEEECKSSYLHMARSGTYSLEKEKRLVDYKPIHTNVETIISAVEDYVKKGLIKI